MSVKNNKISGEGKVHVNSAILGFFVILTENFPVFNLIFLNCPVNEIAYNNWDQQSKNIN